LLTSKDVSSCVNGLKALRKKKIEKINKKYDWRVKEITKDIMSFASSENGVTTKDGKIVMSKQDVADIVEGLKRLRAEYI
jgi:regulator of sigma D